MKKSLFCSFFDFFKFVNCSEFKGGVSIPGLKIRRYFIPDVIFGIFGVTIKVEGAIQIAFYELFSL